MTPQEVHALARRHGLTDEQAVIATAIAWAESGLTPGIVGDVDLEDDTWGPSVGLYQVRSLRADTGTGKERDVERLGDPSFNTRAMVAISAGGTNWTPWSVFKNGRYLDHLEAVRAAVTEGDAMEEWMPGAEHIDRGGGVPVQNNGPTVIVLHTTETDNRASYSGSEPHFEIDDDGSILQYVSIARTAKALYNLPGGVETNRRRGRIIQWELVNRAGKIADISDAQLDGLTESMRWVDTQLPFDKVGPPQGWFGSEAASDDADSRFSFPAWEEFGGICGHQHVPENDHWDPGRFPIDRLLSRLDAGRTPQPVQEDDTMIIIGDAPPQRGGGVWQSDGIVRKPVRTGDTWAQLGDDGARVAKHIGVFDVGTFDDLIDIERALAARIVVAGDGDTVDYGELAKALADELHGRLAG